jgi:hypothetical protein
MSININFFISLLSIVNSRFVFRWIRGCSKIPGFRGIFKKKKLDFPPLFWFKIPQFEMWIPEYPNTPHSEKREEIWIEWNPINFENEKFGGKQGGKWLIGRPFILFFIFFWKKWWIFLNYGNYNLYSGFGKFSITWIHEYMNTLLIFEKWC